MRFVVSLGVLAILLAGCSGQKDVPPDATSDSTSPPPTTSEAPPPEPATTNVLHLLVAPDVGRDAPNGSEIKRTVVTYRAGLEAGEGATWRYTMLATGNLADAVGDVWVQVTEQLVVPPQHLDCAWVVTVSIASGGEAPKQSHTGMCEDAPSTLAPGTYHLQFKGSVIAGVNSQLQPGGTIQFNLRRFGFSPSPNDAVFALSGTPETDSRFQIAGLVEPGAATI